MQQVNSSSTAPNMTQPVGSATQASRRPFDRGLGDQTVRRFGKAWFDLARASRLQAPMFHHPLAVSLLRRERLVSSRPPMDRSRADKTSPILTDSLGEALQRFKDYCSVHFERELEDWREAHAPIQAPAHRQFRPAA